MGKHIYADGTTHVAVSSDRVAGDLVAVARAELEQAGNAHASSTSRRSSGTISDETELQARAEILDAAAAQFAQHGYAATSVDDIATALGATKGRIYHYYENKAQLLLGIARLGLTGLMTQVICEYERPWPSEAERLYAMSFEHCMVLMMSMARHKASIQEVRTRMAMDGPLRQMRELQQVRKMRATYENLFVNVIQRGQERGEFVALPPRLASKHVLGALNGLIVWYQPRKSARPGDLKDIARGLSQFVLRGLRAETGKAG